MNRQLARRQPRTEPVPKPPSIKSNIYFTHRFRYAAVSGAGTGVTVADLLLAIAVKITTTSASSVIQAFRIKSLELWSNVQGTGNATVSVLWNSSTTNASEMEISDSTTSSAVPAHIHTAPPRNGQASFWQGTNNPTINLFSVQANTLNTVMDLVLDVVLADGNTSVTENTPTAAQPVGTVVSFGIPSNTTTVFSPVSLTTPI